MATHACEALVFRKEGKKKHRHTKPCHMHKTWEEGGKEGRKEEEEELRGRNTPQSGENDSIFIHPVSI